MSQTKIVAISSFPCYGNAGLKPMLTILSGHLIPVPSILLTATSDIPGFIKTSTAFETLLEGTLEFCKDSGMKVVLFCGYFYKASQIDFTVKMYYKYKVIITSVILDPIMGDDGRIYVEKEILNSMPRILAIANIVIPNITELGVLASGNLDINGQIQELLSQHPALTIIVKSIRSKKERIGIKVRSLQTYCDIYHRYIPVKFGGTGDVFVSYFINNYIINKISLPQSVKKAAHETLKCIKKSIKLGGNELICV